MLLLGKQHVILHVENARGVVGALQMQPEPREPVGVVAQHGPVGRAVESQRGLLHEAQEFRQFLPRRGALAPDFLQFDPGTVDGVPHLGGQRGAYRARVEPRRLDAILDRGGVGIRERQILDDVLLVGFLINFVETGADAGGQQRRIPLVGLADIGRRQRGYPQRRIDGARKIFGALDIAGQPVQVFGGARQHANSYSSRIQVSLVPPPWLELTTSEPSFSATRVSPPGTMVVCLLPVSTKGRRSTWRGARPDAVQVGHVESASVGWAIKPSGSRLSLSRNASMVALVAAGPISMP